GCVTSALVQQLDGFGKSVDKELSRLVERVVERTLDSASSRAGEQRHGLLCAGRGGAQKAVAIFHGHGTRKQIALHEIAAQPAQDFELLRRFHSLSHNPQAKLLGQRYDRLYDGSVS